MTDQTHTFTIAAPPDFRYLPTVNSHGWCILAPFDYDETTHVLTRIQRLSDGSLVKLTIAPVGEDALTVTVDGLNALTDARRDDIAHIVARCLSFDHDLSEFYALMRATPGYEWVERVGAGRMLVSPTAWEDLAKTLLTTNTVWRMTIQMVERLSTLGTSYNGGGHAFPTPEQVAAHDPNALNAHVRAGYRGAYLHTLAESIANGKLDPERWRDPAMPSDEVYRQLRQVKGFGEYAAGATMRLLERFDQLGLDSVCRTMFKTQINGGTAATDKEIAAYYARFGSWRGLVIWMDVLKSDYTQD